MFPAAAVCKGPNDSLFVLRFYLVAWMKTTREVKERDIKFDRSTQLEALRTQLETANVQMLTSSSDRTRWDGWGAFQNASLGERGLFLAVEKRTDWDPSKLSLVFINEVLVNAGLSFQLQLQKQRSGT